MRSFRSSFCSAVGVILLLALQPTVAQTNAGHEVVTIDANAAAHPFPHFWEKMFGSGRAILSLRESYRRDLSDVKQITDVRYVRFHAIFHDEVGIYDEDGSHHPIYNFSYVDQIYDGLLAKGVKPFVELSFMPKKLASAPTLHSFWYKPYIAPPNNWTNWEDLIKAFAKHLVDRYGIDEVASWYFEVWNEPNIDFWAGEPKQATYWQLYDHSARAIKAVSPRLRIGGPATAQAAWVDAFIKHCADENVPVDFVTTHVYGNDRSQDVFGTDENIPRNKMVCRAVAKVHEQIKSSSRPNLPLIWSEFNASYMTEPAVTDSVYMGPWLAETIRQCDGLVEMMSYWAFSDVFEEQGVVRTPFYGGYGLIAADNIPKPAYNAFLMLHKLGDQRLDLASDSVLVTRGDHGSLVLAAWNYAPPDEAGSTKTLTLHFKNTSVAKATVWRLDANHGDVHRRYEEMGQPRYPTAPQIVDLRRAAHLGSPEQHEVTGGELTLPLPAHSLVVIETH